MSREKKSQGKSYVRLIHSTFFMPSGLSWNTSSIPKVLKILNQRSIAQNDKVKAEKAQTYRRSSYFKPSCNLTWSQGYLVTLFQFPHAHTHFRASHGTALTVLAVWHKCACITQISQTQHPAAALAEFVPAPWCLSSKTAWRAWWPRASQKPGTAAVVWTLQLSGRRNRWFVASIPTKYRGIIKKSKPPPLFLYSDKYLHFFICSSYCKMFDSVSAGTYSAHTPGLAAGLPLSVRHGRLLTFHETCIALGTAQLSALYKGRSKSKTAKKEDKQSSAYHREWLHNADSNKTASLFIWNEQ